MEDIDLESFFRGKAQAWGVAPAVAFSGAPEGHHPEDVLQGAVSVIVFGIAVPQGVFRSPRYLLYALHRSYHTLYPQLDLTGLQLSLYLEGLGFSAAPVPSYAPLIFRGVEPRGILSLKHAAWLAGLGAFGRSGMVYHPSYGARLRLGAVVTTAGLEPARPVNGSPCPEGCRECLESCPSGALSDEGFDKMACLAYAIRHGIYPLAFRDEEGIRNMELVINTAGYDYWIRCCECLRACPLNSQGP